ncbi:MAG: tetratricopeptide repeat protein [Thermodesulfobacteriota bacterium]
MLLIGFGCAPVAAPVAQGNVAELYNQGRYAEAIPLAEQELAGLEKSKGRGSPEAAAAMNMLGLLYHAVGDFDRAEPLLKRALAVRQRTYGLEDHRTAETMNNLALVYEAEGDFARAEPLYRGALAAREKELGTGHPEVAAAYGNLAAFYYSLGDFAQAVATQEKALRSLEQSLGPDHPAVAAGLTTLAGMYAALDRFDQAELLYRKALRIREAKLGADHPETAAVYSGLALLFQEKGDHGQAVPLYEKALSLLERRGGEDNLDLAAACNNLALLYQRQGDLDRAVSFTRKALSLLEGDLGPMHPEVAAGLENLAGLYATRGEYPQALEAFRQAQTIEARVIDQVLGFTSEERKLGFLAVKRGALEGFLSLVSQYLAGDPAAPTEAFNAWLAHKGIMVEAQRRFQEAVVGPDPAPAHQLFQRLALVRAQLARILFAGPGRLGSRTYRKRIEQLEKDLAGLETELSGLSRAYARYKELSRADAKAVAQALPSGSVLLEFARINLFDFQARGGQDRWRPARYLVFVLFPGPESQVRLADLGPAAPIDRSVTELKKAVTDLRDKDGGRTAAASREVYDLVFAPLSGLIGGARRLLVAPDGNLSLIPFEVLQGPDGGFLLEDYTFDYLTSGRDVIVFGGHGRSGGRPVLVGDPDFDLGPVGRSAALAGLGLETAAAAPAPLAEEMLGFRFDRLPGTLDEVEAIKEILGGGVRVYTGSEALEEALGREKAPRLLHLATHGFFLGDIQFWNLVGQDRQPGKQARFVNPLLRSGLALAGINRALSATGGASEGVLTADKVLGLNLRGTDLVVLSACDTGLGDPETGEGVYGLRRAFFQAGAKGLVMSLWPVPDRETRELMVGFYRNLTSGGFDRAEALRAAALEEMEVVRSRYGWANPFFWGAFVFLGAP